MESEQPKQHGVDAEVASETHQFDQAAEQAAAQQTPLQGELAVEMQRLVQYANFLLNKQQRAGNMLIDVHVHKNLMRAELIALSELVMEKLGISNEELTRRTIDELRRDLMIYQMDSKTIITPDGCIQEEKK